ncbi:Uncharacterised protein [Vibrio cholerae]|nr:Uncharacterised protein [Vibrio cholerae]
MIEQHKFLIAASLTRGCSIDLGLHAKARRQTKLSAARR